MESKKIETLDDFLAYAKWHFTSLKGIPEKKNMYTVEIRLAGYWELIAISANLMKLCILALEEEPEISGTVKNPRIDVSLVLEIALQLIPFGEVEVLDELHQLLIDRGNQDNPDKPE